jgi:RIO-like serine/threonine protein kinase
MFSKVAKGQLEAEVQGEAAKHSFAPRIHRVDGDVVHMDSIKGACLADIYTDDAARVPAWIWAEIHRILAVLFECERVEYVDITSYNFMLESDTNKVWIVDFGDAYYTTAPLQDGVRRPLNWFLKAALDGEKGWNPDFA